MTTIETGTRAPRVSLSALLAERDASIAIGSRTLALAVLRAKRAFGVARSMIRGFASFAVMLLAFLFSQVVRHGLVLAGLSSFVLAGWTYSPIAGMVTLGASLFFLELRRK